MQASQIFTTNHVNHYSQNSLHVAIALLSSRPYTTPQNMYIMSSTSREGACYVGMGVMGGFLPILVYWGVFLYCSWVMRSESVRLEVVCFFVSLLYIYFVGHTGSLDLRQNEKDNNCAIGCLGSFGLLQWRKRYSTHWRAICRAYGVYRRKWRLRQHVLFDNRKRAVYRLYNIQRCEALGLLPSRGYYYKGQLSKVHI